MKQHRANAIPANALWHAAGSANCLAADTVTDFRSLRHGFWSYARPSRQVFVGIVLALFLAAAARADDRLWLEARINGQQSRLIFDTGADRVILFPQGVKRLGLTVTQSPPNGSPGDGRVAIGFSELCDLTLWQTTVRTRLAVLEMPTYLHMGADGVIGWGPLSKNVLQLDASALRAEFLEEVPPESKNWLSLQICTNSGFLFLKTPVLDSSNAVVLVDTGFVGGVALSPQKWREWKTRHAGEPTTLDSYFMPGAGLVVKEQMWASKLALGPLSLTDVPVMEANSAQVAVGGAGYQASIGLTALKRLDVIIDGCRGMAHLHAKQAPVPDYVQNRLGAVFVPTLPLQDALFARVVPHSPAFEAGIRDGDVLLKIDKLDVTNWRTRPGILPLARFWEEPAGTRLCLTLERRGVPYSTTVRLREILSASQSPT